MLIFIFMPSIMFMLMLRQLSKLSLPVTVIATHPLYLSLACRGCRPTPACCAPIAPTVYTHRRYASQAAETTLTLSLCHAAFGPHAPVRHRVLVCVCMCECVFNPPTPVTCSAPFSRLLQQRHLPSSRGQGFS
ncbi:hypothetical protein LZ31DRAFT_221970 [Colletotrichum somersetense]|nr:hypothetical protein LZ31DRAFT_221970 [Colletotrichum somersetense]